MKTFYNVTNDWNADTLSDAGTWVNDGRSTTNDLAVAELMLENYLIDHPEDAGRVAVSSYDMAEEDYNAMHVAGVVES